jgi:GGDEF domain-containing protein
MAGPYLSEPLGNTIVGAAGSGNGRGLEHLEPRPPTRPALTDLSLDFSRIGHVLFQSTGPAYRRHVETLRRSGFDVTLMRGSPVDRLLSRRTVDLVVVAERSAKLRRTALRHLGDLTHLEFPTLILGDARPGTALHFSAATTPRRLHSAVSAVCARVRFLRELSPSTELPGKTWIFKQLQERLDNRLPYALLFFDIDRFKSVSDTYGFHRSELFLKALGRALVDTGIRGGPPYPKVGHIGGDDFIVLCEPSQVLPYTRGVVTSFESAADRLYDAADAQRGYVLVDSRRNRQQRAALVTLSIGAIESKDPDSSYGSIRHAATAVAEMKRVAKSQPGSYVAVDRRYVPTEDR